MEWLDYDGEDDDDEENLEIEMKAKDTAVTSKAVIPDNSK
jgi:hypothetical protein